MTSLNYSFIHHHNTVEKENQKKREKKKKTEKIIIENFSLHLVPLIFLSGGGGRGMVACGGRVRRE